MGFLGYFFVFVVFILGVFWFVFFKQGRNCQNYLGTAGTNSRVERKVLFIIVKRQ